jgi:ribonuclease HI
MYFFGSYSLNGAGFGVMLIPLHGDIPKYAI